MSITTTPSHLQTLPHGIDITAPGGIDALMEFHRSTFGDAQMNANGDGDGEQPKPKPPRTFTQDELNAILAEDRRKTAEKYADYDELKTKAEKLDEAEQENQTELQKAIARAEKAEQDAAAERSARETAERQSLAALVAAEKGVPATHISGSTREELEQSAEQLIAWRGGNQQEQEEVPSKVGGYIPHSGTGQQGAAPVAPLGGREAALAKHGKTKN
ncbi:hypothetical protein [Brachybacterium paraconglomeratum]|uniref:hypothetical protein n=1 Tax=Brachybacterium paraconglomeratum TaxID=173362 RepID=UPI0022AED683|nr:hypothetical protein [Brachybacterium paraconglomeratum]MCZ4325678.1 hypothetical protein [Brachybacterium paraconglomeratum]